jgi:copper chaperone
MSKAVLQLETLTCPSCIKKIESTITKKTGVDAAKVIFNSSKVKIDYQETQVVVQELKETIEKLGYEVLSTKSS